MERKEKIKSAYNSMFKDIEQLTIGYEDMLQWVKEIFLTSGMNAEDAFYCAENLVMSDLRTVYSHGVMRVPIYYKRLRTGCTSATGEVEIVRNHGAIARISGNNAMGQVVGVKAMKIAIEKAKEYGVGFVSVGQSNHYGFAAYFSMMALSDGMIGITGTIGSTRNIAPWGGIEPLLGNNPFSTAIPAYHRYPIVMDMANSVVARGKIVMARKLKQPIPETWALGRDGKPTTDAEEAYWGTLMPVGGHKGYGLTVITGLISALLSESTFGVDVTDLYEEFETAQNVGHYMQAIDIAAFTDPVKFGKQVDEFIEQMKSSRKRDGVDEIYMPGELEAIAARKQKSEGISYPIDVIKELRSLSKEVGVEPYL